MQKEFSESQSGLFNGKTSLTMEHKNYNKTQYLQQAFVRNVVALLQTSQALMLVIGNKSYF